jgi:zinc protease
MSVRTILLILSMVCAFATGLVAQEKPPAPGPAKGLSVPPVKEAELADGLKVAVVERHNLPIVTIQMMIKSGAADEAENKAGLADLTASMLTKGTATRTATQIAEAIEFLGGSINTGAGWNSSYVSVTVTSDKVDRALEILADVLLHPKFDDAELQRLKSQIQDNLTVELKNPNSLASYVVSKYSFGEHPAGGTPATVSSITVADVRRFYRENYKPSSSVLIFAGDITAAQANSAAVRDFETKSTSGGIGNGRGPTGDFELEPMPGRTDTILVIDLPNSGQAAVAYTRKMTSVGRGGADYHSASLLNSVLGGGYSSRLNLEIRIKRGLSYGAGSSISWRPDNSNFLARAQTKNESAAEVAQLLVGEVQRLADAIVAPEEMTPRRSTLTGGFGRNLETTAGLASALGELYAYGIPTTELNAYVAKIGRVTAPQLESFVSGHLLKGQLVIVGDYSVFKNDLEKRFPSMKVRVIKADDLDVAKHSLHK